MPYSKFRKLKKTLDRFHLSEEGINMFPNIVEIEPSAWLIQSLVVAKMVPLTNEKGKSERIISPILGEIAVAYIEKITLFSGEDLTIEGEDELSGECDFFFANRPHRNVIVAPIITLVEAKNEDFEHGQAQCVAQMYAAMRYNELADKPLPFIYGCASTGGEWKFLRLENNRVFVDSETYYLTQLPKILGIFHQIVASF